MGWGSASQAASPLFILSLFEVEKKGEKVLMSPNSQRFLRWIGLVASMMAIVGFFSSFRSPIVEVWIEMFGSEEERALRDYKKMMAESKEDSVAREALSWKAKQDSINESWKAEMDSLERFFEREAVKCIKREIERGKEKPCESSVYYYKESWKGRTGWFIGATECLENFHIPAYSEDFPVSLLDRKWLKRNFLFRSKIEEQEVARLDGRCR